MIRINFFAKFISVNLQKYRLRKSSSADGVGKTIYAVKGNMARFDFRMMWVNSFRYIGDMVEDYAPEQGGRSQQRATDTNTGIDHGLQAAE